MAFGKDGKIGFALIGTGVIGQQHARNLNQSDAARLVVVCSRDEEKVRAFAEKNHTVWVTDYRKAIFREDVQAVLICTPSGFHAEPALFAFEHQKHALVEKPLEIDLAKAEQMTKSARDNQCKLGVMFQRRMNPVFQQLKSDVDAGRLGDLVCGEATLKWYRSPEYFQNAGWRGTRAMDGGGALMNQGIHFLDILLWLMGDVSDVHAYAATRVHRIDVEDTLVANLEFKSGALGVIQMTTAAYPGIADRIELCGTQGSVIVESEKLRYQYYSDQHSDPAPDYGLHIDAGLQPISDSTVNQEDHFKKVTDDFIRAIVEDRDPLISGEAGLRSLRVIDAIYRSCR